MRIFVLGLILSAIALPCLAKNIKTTRHKTATMQIASAKEQFDTLTGAAVRASVYGYDKPLNGTREEMFIYNEGEDTIARVSIEITYFDMEGRTLHKRRETLATEIPPSEARRLDIYSWDKNRSFYFIGSKKPRVSAIPYEITCTIDTLFIKK